MCPDMIIIAEALPSTFVKPAYYVYFIYPTLEDALRARQDTRGMRVRDANKKTSKRGEHEYALGAGTRRHHSRLLKARHGTEGQ